MYSCFGNLRLTLIKAEELIGQGVDFNLEKIKVYRQFFTAYEQLSDYKNAARYQKKYISLKDSIYDETLITNLMKVEADYLERENAAKLQVQAEVISLRDEAIERQWWINVLSILVISALIVILVILFYNFRQRKSINERLELKVKERTRALEENQSRLIKACDARDYLISRAVADISNIQASVQGLFNVGQSDIAFEKNNPEFLKSIHHTSVALNRTIAMMQVTNKD